MQINNITAWLRVYMTYQNGKWEAEIDDELTWQDVHGLFVGGPRTW